MSCKNFWIRLCALRNLIFFSLILFSACDRKPAEITIRWDNERATGISIPKNLAGEISDSLEHRLSVRLVTEGKSVSMLGNYTVVGDEVLFEPLIPFTRGLHYEVLLAGEHIGQINVPVQAKEDAPVIQTIYPTQDTVPENLLKMYLQFSKSMREGVSARYIHLLKDNRDTVAGAFLDLQPELWNADQTILTLWLDPGRIKRDLQPNKLLGSPLKNGEHYTLMISDQWKDKQGSSLSGSYEKHFTVTLRDSISPDPKKWIFQTPKTATTSSLTIHLGSSLDYSLLNSTLAITDKNEKIIPGKWHIGPEEKEISFIPSSPWTSGQYQLNIETRIEDLAGNNINRAFDTDIRSASPNPAPEKKIILKKFTIE